MTRFEDKGPMAWLTSRIWPEGAQDPSPQTYRRFRRRMIALMALVSIIPLLIMFLINSHEYHRAIKGEIETPILGLLNKTRHSLEIFLAERRSAVSFIASAYEYSELADQNNLGRIFQSMKREFGGFVDLGLIDSAGLQVSYAGPYELAGKNYREQEWFREVTVRGTYTSNVFLGYRKYPHLVIAVQHMLPSGRSWIVRATIETDKFSSLVSSVGLGPHGDAFVISRTGVLQTPSKYFGNVLDRFPLDLPPPGQGPSVREMTDHEGKPILLGYNHLPSMPFILVVVKPRAGAWQAWTTLRSDMFLILAVSVVIIFVVVYRLTDMTARRIEKSEQMERQAIHEMEQHNKLASIGRLAAGVAHEINNPLAIIDQKAGLMQDILKGSADFQNKEKFDSLTVSILKAVDRCRTITHRLLGFARRMDVDVTIIDLNQVLREVIGFLEKEAAHRNIDLTVELASDLPRIASDQGQLQQVFLNVLNNAFDAVQDGGRVSVTTWEPDMETVGVSIMDNGAGMSEETRQHIFEPFFTTKKGYGTGLGLSITYGIIKKLGGDIRVDSRKGDGATFIITLPKKAHPQ